MHPTRVPALLAVLLLLTACGDGSTGGPSGRDADGAGAGYRVGAGIYDITGPAAGVGMMGYSMPDQQTAGIHMRLRSRAFVIAEPGDGKRVALVIADLGQAFQAVKQEVVRRLRQDPELGARYDERNVLISATHTHSGPGGYSHYDLYNLSILGFVEQNFTVITSGIVESIRRAHRNLAPGRILINRGELLDCGWNASPVAYLQNPEGERSAYAADTDRTMTLLRLETTAGEEVGTINWFPVHPTNLGNTLRLISGDNKGFAAYRFEREKGTDYTAPSTFVAAFAQSNAGDVSPSVFWGYPDGIHDFERMEIMGERQYAAAAELYRTARTPLTGGIDYRHVHVDLSRVEVGPEWLQDREEGIRTCTAALGLSMLAGSTEDAVGLPFVPEGIVWGGGMLPEIPLVPEEQPCHAEKYVFISLGGRSPVPWTPEILPIQLVRIGQLVIIAQPSEISTMAGRRLRDTVLRDLAGIGVQHAVIAALSNAYAGYVTTREEYAVQQYEGASVHFGPYTLNAYQQSFSRLARAMAEGEELPPGPSPRDLSDRQVEAPASAAPFDLTPRGYTFGDVQRQPEPAYPRGETVSVGFWGGHPANDLRTQDSFLYVERETASGAWEVIARDEDPETRFHWERWELAGSKITVEWTIPEDALPGTYRIRHAGTWRSVLTGEKTPYSGVSDTFTVR